MKYLLLFAFTVLAGCATPTGNTRSSTPHYNLTLGGDIDLMATCVLHRLEANKPSLEYEYRNLTVDLKEIKGSRSTYNLGGYGGEFFNILVTFSRGSDVINVTIQETTSRPSDIAQEAKLAAESCQITQ